MSLLPTAQWARSKSLISINKKLKILTKETKNFLKECKFKEKVKEATDKGYFFIYLTVPFKDIGVNVKDILKKKGFSVSFVEHSTTDLYISWCD